MRACCLENDPGRRSDLRPMGLNDHEQALKAAEQRVESLKVSL